MSVKLFRDISLLGRDVYVNVDTEWIPRSASGKAVLNLVSGSGNHFIHLIPSENYRTLGKILRGLWF